MISDIDDGADSDGIDDDNIDSAVISKLIATALTPIQQQVTNLSQQVTYLNQNVESQIDSHVARIDSRVSATLAAQREQTTQFVKGYMEAQQQELQRRVDVCILVEVAKAYEEVSKLFKKTQAQTELRLREIELRLRQVVTAPETRETQSDVEAIEVYDEQLPILEAIAVVAESEQGLITDTVTELAAQTAIDKIEHLPLKTVHTVSSSSSSDSSSDDGWLAVKDAYPIAVQRGYTSNKHAFTNLTPPGFKKRGFEIDPSRRKKGSPDSRWIRLIPDWSSEDAQ